VESPSIGSFNTFQARSQATSSVGISDRCMLSAGTTLEGGEGDVLPPYTVIYGSRSERVIGEKANWEAEENLRIKHLGYLREIMPKYVPDLRRITGLSADVVDSIVCARYEVIHDATTTVFDKELSPSRYSPGCHPLDNLSRCWYIRYAWRWQDSTQLPIERGRYHHEIMHLHNRRMYERTRMDSGFWH